MASKTRVNTGKKAEGKKRQDELKSAADRLALLSGKDISKLSKSELDKLLIAICCRIGVADANGVLK